MSWTFIGLGVERGKGEWEERRIEYLEAINLSLDAPSHCIHLWDGAYISNKQLEVLQQIPNRQILNVYLWGYSYIWTQSRIHFLSITEMIWKTDIVLQIFFITWHKHKTLIFV